MPGYGKPEIFGTGSPRGQQHGVAAGQHVLSRSCRSTEHEEGKRKTTACCARSISGHAAGCAFPRPCKMCSKGKSQQMLPKRCSVRVVGALWPCPGTGGTGHGPVQESSEQEQCPCWAEHEQRPFETEPCLQLRRPKYHWEGQPRICLLPGLAKALWSTGFFPSPFTFTGFILALIPASLLTDYFILTLWLSCLVGGIFLSIIFIKRSAQKQGPELLF